MFYKHYLAFDMVFLILCHLSFIESDCCENEEGLSLASTIFSVTIAPFMAVVAIVVALSFYIFDKGKIAPL